VIALPTILSLTMLALVVVGGCASTTPPPGSPCEVSRPFEPWDTAAVTAPPPPIAPAGGLADALLATYQRSLRRPEQGAAGGCPFEPTCSHFARQAFDRYGLAGLLLVVDRLLIREHPLAGNSYVSTCVGGRVRWHDPVP